MFILSFTKISQQVPELLGGKQTDMLIYKVTIVHKTRKLRLEMTVHTHTLTPIPRYY